MKTRYFFGIAITAIVCVSLMIVGCKSNKPVSITKVNDEIEVLVPCAEYSTDADFFRGQGVGQSKDLNTAREKARMAAYTELASSMRVWIKQLTEKYVNDSGHIPADYGETFESLSKQKIDEQMSNIMIVCNKTMRTSDGMYKVYLAAEADRKKIFESFEQGFSSDKKLETLYNREKFRKLYSEEMESFKKTTLIE